MTSGIAILSTLLGVALIAFVLCDIFHTLFHASGELSKCLTNEGVCGTGTRDTVTPMPV